MNTFLLTTLGLLAGVCLFAAVHHFWIGIRRPVQSMHLLFALLCVIAMCYVLTKIGAYQVTTAAELVSLRRTEFLFAAVFFGVLPWFIVCYTSLPSRKLLWLSTLMWLFMIVANQLLPYGVAFNTLPEIHYQTLPWGEQVADLRALQHGPWYFAAWACILLAFANAAYASIRLYRHNGQRRAVSLALAMAIFLTFALFNQLINFGIINFIHLGEFGFVAMVLLMHTAISRELHDAAGLLRVSEVQVRRMAYEDYLTGLPNRAALHEYLAVALQQSRHSGQYGAVLLIDLDHFKTINDSLTHEVGDQVLRYVAKRLRDDVAQRAFVARLGGDEFVVVMSNLSQHAETAVNRADELAEEILRAMNQPLLLGEQSITVGASIGAVLFPEQSDTELEIFRHADIALYQAKSKGRHTVQFFLPSMQVAAHERLNIEKGMRHAIANQELCLYFQPQLDIAGQVIGLEVLLRWFHPEYGGIAPTRFIPIAEETGLIHGIGSWVFERACEHIDQWEKNQLPFSGSVAVNVSPWQFTRPDFVRQIEGVLSRYSVPSSRLTLEITETAMLYDREEAVAKFQALRTLGLKISLDDFGTGYSSLAYLTQLPLDELKIDRAFMSDLAMGNKLALVESIITIGRHMDMRVIAEGVETTVQHDLLMAKGCRYFQGFHFCQPLPERELFTWLTSHQRAAPH